MRNRQMHFLMTALLLMTLLPGGVADSQAPAACPQIVQLALDTTDQVCSGVGDNQACYGHVLVDAVPRAGVEEFKFSSEGDVARLFDVQTLRLSPMDLDLGTWGVALINMQAYLKYARPENVTFLLFGDVEIEDAGQSLTSLQVTVRASEYVNARLAPGTQAGVLDTLTPGQVLTAQGRTTDGEWVRTVLPSSRRVGWVHHSVLSTDGDLETLRVVADESDYYGPMQAFYFRSGAADAYCPESPESGLLIQTPEGVAEVTLLINEVSIEMQATAFLQAQPGQELTVGVVDGWAEVEANGQRQPVFAGTQVSIPMTTSLQASGTPSAPQPYQMQRMQALPLGILAESVTLSDPLPEPELVLRLNAWYAGDLAAFDVKALDEQEILYYTADGAPVVMGADGVPVAIGNDGLPSVADDTLIDPLDEGLPPETDEVLPPGLDVGPPGLEGVLPPGLGGDNPGTEGGLPPGQAKKD